MSGLSRTPGKRVWDNIPPRVRIPPSPPSTIQKAQLNRWAFCILALHFSVLECIPASENSWPQ